MSTTTMCEFCGELTADKNRHKLVDWRGSSTVIGAVLESFLKIQCASGLPPVCGKCRRSILDHVTGLYKDSGRHVVADNSKDFELVLKTLTNAGVFTYHGGRQHKAMKTIHADPLYGVKQGIDALHKWLSQHRKTAAIEQSIDLKSF